MSRTVLIALVMLVGIPAAVAQDAPKKDRSGGYSAIIDNLDMLIDNYSKFLGRKYDLTEDQDAFTKQVLRDRAHGFLDKHEDSLRDLFDQLFEARSGGDMSPESLVAWGQRVMPIYEEAKQIIVDGNKEWADILTEEQKKIHSEDLRLMDESFSTTEGVLGRIVKGEMTLEEFRNPRFGRVDRNSRASLKKAQQATAAETAAAAGGDAGAVQPITPMEEKRMRSRVADQPVTPQPEGDSAEPVHMPPPPPPGDLGNTVPAGDSTPGQVTTPTPVTDRRGPKAAGGKTGKNFESEWEKYVREFIAKYSLEDEQAQRANTILADCQQQAERYLNGKKSELDGLEKREKELSNTKAAGGKEPAAAASDRTKELSEATKRKEELMKPIGDIFEKTLKPRLDKLPTRAQRKAADEAAAKKKPAAAAPVAKPAKPEKKADAPRPADVKPGNLKPANPDGAKPAEPPKSDEPNPEEKPEAPPESKP